MSEKKSVWDTREPKWWASLQTWCDAHGIGEDDRKSLMEIILNAINEDAAVSLGSAGGLKGGKARAAALTPRQRIASARKAAKARWKSQEGR